MKDSLGLDATSKLSLAEDDQEKKHADSAFFAAIFPSCNHPAKPGPAGGQTMDGWERCPEPRQLPGASDRSSQASQIIKFIFNHEQGEHKQMEVKIVLTPTG